MALRPIYRMLHRRACRSTHAEVFEHAEDMAFFAAGGMIGVGGGSIIPGAGIDVPGFQAARAAVHRRRHCATSSASASLPWS